MKQDIQLGKWLEIDTKHEGVCAYPAHYFDAAFVAKEHDMSVDDVVERTGYGARLSAPGYTDATEWCVFDTEQKAREYLAEMYGDDDEIEGD